MRLFCAFIVLFVATLLPSLSAIAQTREFNSGGGTNATNGLHFYIDNTSKIQVRRLNNTGQVYLPTATPPNNSLDNGVFLRANGLIYGPSHTVGSAFNPSGGMYNTATISATSPPNPSSNGVQQSATSVLGVTGGPTITIVWKYTTPLDFLTAEVTLVIPGGYPVTAANPVRYYHVFDTYLGGSDQGCGVNVAGPPRIVGTYSAISGACPTSTSLPAAGTIVESFRERTGNFTRYCAGLWSSFFNNGGINCSVRQAAQMSNTITTTLQDTGIGIEYDFTAPGTYTFSYDFVIGTTTVPPYDHIEIRHDGSATLCPENIVVVACTNAGASCTPVSTGTITGNVSLVPAAAGVTFTPSSFSIGGSGTSANIVMQASAASAGTYTLVATGLNVAPLNGTKCTNLAGNVATSCDIVIANTPCVANFECIETTLAYANRNVVGNRNPLYTKLAGTAFSFDVVALDASGNIAPSFAGNVEVELYDDTADPVCSAATAIAGTTQSFAFVAGDNGRKTITTPYNLAAAYGDLRCRVRTTSAPVVTACSSDALTVRPSALSLSSSANADPLGNDPNAATIVKAGANFTITAASGVVGYNGTPQINSSQLHWGNVPVGGLVAPGVGSLTGVFSAANAVTGTAQGTSFTYSEVGFFRFLTQGVFDQNFTSLSGDNANNDCTNDASNALVGDKYGCRFGNTSASVYFGRFVPDRFTVSSKALSQGCSANNFTYMDQPFSLTATLEARNTAGARTYNYSGTYAKATVTPEMENGNSGVVIPNARLSRTGSWSGGVYSFSATQFVRDTNPDGPYDDLVVGLAISDPDGSLQTDRDMQASTTSCTASTPGNTDGNCTAHRLSPVPPVAPFRMRHGRVRLDNAYGSERLPLPVPMTIEYWAGTPSVGNFVGWTKNALDTSCTVPVVANFSLSFPPSGSGKVNNLSACETAVSTLPLKLSAPGLGNDGWVEVTLNLGVASGNQCSVVGPAGPAATSMGAPWLQYNWTSGTNSNPKAVMRFGAYKRSNKFIYTREVH